jgi:hypothetical protein
MFCCFTSGQIIEKYTKALLCILHPYVCFLRGKNPPLKKCLKPCILRCGGGFPIVLMWSHGNGLITELSHKLVQTITHHNVVQRNLFHRGVGVVVSPLVRNCCGGGFPIDIISISDVYAVSVSAVWICAAALQLKSE